MDEVIWSVFVINTIKSCCGDLEWAASFPALIAPYWREWFTTSWVLAGRKRLLFIAGQPMEIFKPAQGPSRLLRINPHIDRTSGTEIRRVASRKPGYRKNWFALTSPHTHTPPPRRSTSTRCIIHGMRFSSDLFIHAMKFLTYICKHKSV